MNDKKLYLQKIKQNFPNLKFSKSELITAGYDDDVIILDKKIVFSFPKNKLDCNKKFQKELKILPFLNRAITLPIPNYMYIPKDKSFAGYTYISGVPFVKKLFDKLNTREQVASAKLVAKFLYELHSFSIIKARKNGVTDAWTEQDARPYYIRRARAVFKQLNYDFQSLQKLLSRYPMKDTARFAVVHQDFTSDHILFDIKKKKIQGVIDFGDVQIADPAIDFSKLWDYGEEFLDLVLHYYKSNDPYLKERSLRWWIYHNINLVEYGYDKKNEDMWKKGYTVLKELYGT
ncbi:MAG: aminoglycoside phosphotransferase family protein [Candidatus Magasanikbacteria bacterium]|nr:aminoglycoside phosphotransferase family protein [Candidatus Magasanikbacteria bacterium]